MLPAAVFDALPVRPSRRTFEAALAALGLVTLFVPILPPFFVFATRFYLPSSDITGLVVVVGRLFNLILPHIGMNYKYIISVSILIQIFELFYPAFTVLFAYERIHEP